ncbi:ATP-binding protein [Microtetraspora sp. AC03309]|uniref:ATP-binding protein n=1 Tax=Microtetraspora sp. AC03309 TaxID=2779376 RepID=UPI001E3F8BF4|nr:ATP-binding protein [Microtetraspora sp. AC03309]MCC5577162.1 ATP-binding protein [Microtetraspora sp. AC03309]
MTIDIAAAGVRNAPVTSAFSARRTWAVDWDRAWVKAETEAVRPSREPERAPETLTATWELPQRLASTCMARRVTRARLNTWGLPQDTIDVAELLVSELAGNALRHTHGPVQLSLFFTEGLLRCEVEDADRNPPRIREADDDDERGRGLSMLDLLSCCWGSDPTPTGKIVWFELSARSDVGLR